MKVSMLKDDIQPVLKQSKVCLLRRVMIGEESVSNSMKYPFEKLASVHHEDTGVNFEAVEMNILRK